VHDEKDNTKIANTKKVRINFFMVLMILG
jgi:hypothetical protein